MLVALLSLLAACGGEGDGEGAEGRPTTATRRASPAPGAVTIEHRYGTTELAERPERIVSLDPQWTDVLIALDAPPAGYIPDPNVDGGTMPWWGDALADAAAIEATDSLPYEQIAAARPDLIVVTYFAEDQAAYDRLAEIAPTIATLSDNQVDTWQDITEAAGRVLGAEDEAQALVDDVDGQVAAVAEELPGLDGKTFVLVNYVPNDAFYIVSDPEDGANVLFDQLGMEISPTVLEAGDGVSGRVEISLEQAELLDADVLLLFTGGADPEGIVGYDELPAVQAGSAAVLDYVEVIGLNTPGPLSLPYALDAIRPTLAAAAEPAA